MLFLLLILTEVNSNNFGTLTLVRNETLIIGLLDYFTGNELNFSISCPPDKSSTYGIQQRELTKKISSNFNGYLTYYSYVRDFEMRSVGNNGIKHSYYFNQTAIFMIATNIANFYSNVNKVFIVNPGSQDFYIKKVGAVYLSSYKFYLLVHGRSPSLMKNQFFVIDTPSNSITEVSIKGLDDVIDLELLFTSAYYYALFNGTKDQHSTLFVVDFSSLYSPVLIQTLIPFSSNGQIQYSYIQGFENNQAYLLVLDINSNLYVYQYIDKEFKMLYSNPLALYGKCLKLLEVSSDHIAYHQSAIVTNEGLLQFDYENRTEIMYYKFPSYINGEFLGFFNGDNFIILVYRNNISIILAVVSAENLNDVLNTITLEFDNFNPYGPWGMFSDDSGFYFLHIDYQMINLVNFLPSVPSFNITLKDSQINCQIQAVDYLNQTTYKNISLLDSNSTYFQISQLYQGVNYSNPLEYKTTLNNNKTCGFTLPMFMITGWNLSCSFEDKEYEDILIKDITSPKVLDFYEFNSTAEFQLLMNGLLVIYSDNFLTVSNATSMEGYSYQVDYVVDIQVMNSFNSIIIIMLELYKGIYSCRSIIVKDNDFEGALISDFSLYSNLYGNAVLNVIDSYLLIYNSYNVQIYQFNSSIDTFQYINYISSSYALIFATIYDSNSLPDNILLYLCFENNIEIYTLSILTTKYYTIKNYFSSELIGYTKLLICEGTISILTPSFIVTIDFMLTNIINIINIQINDMNILDSFIVGISNDYLYLINSTEMFNLESVYYMRKLESPNYTLLGFTYDFNSNSIIGISNGDSILLLSVRCPSLNNLCDKDINVSISFNETLDQDITNYTTTLSIKCRNSESYAKFDYALDIYAYGLKIKQKKSNFNMTLSINQDSYIYLDNYYYGNDLSFDIDYYVNRSNFKYKNPITLIPSLDLISCSNISDSLTGMTLLKNTSYALILSSYESMYFVDILNDKIVLNKTLYLNSDLICPFIQNFALKNSLNYLIFLCSHKKDKFTQKSYLLLYALDSDNNLKNISQYPLNYTYSLMKIIPATDSLFLIVLVEESSSNGNNHVEIFKLTIRHSIELQYLHNLNFYSLNLPEFVCKSIEGEFNYQGSITLYIVDYYKGVIIISYKNYLLSSIDYLGLNKIASIGFCGNQLFIGCSDTSVLVYKKQNSKFYLIYKFYQFNDAANSINSISGFIICNEFYHASYAILPIISNEGYYGIRTFNVEGNRRSEILGDIPISKSIPQFGCNNWAYFYNSSVFITINTFSGSISTYKINRPKLIFETINSEIYSLIKEEWGNYEIAFSLGASNLISSAKSEISYYSIKYQEDDSNSSNSVSNTVVVIVIGVVFISIIAISIIGFLIYKRMGNTNKTEEVRPFLSIENISYKFATGNLDISLCSNQLVRNTTIN